MVVMTDKDVASLIAIVRADLAKANAQLHAQRRRDVQRIFGNIAQAIEDIRRDVIATWDAKDRTP